MTEDSRKLIDAMSYEDMLRRWRFAPVGDPLFQGDTGDYFAESMAKKKSSVGNEAHTRASKAIGWDKP